MHKLCKSFQRFNQFLRSERDETALLLKALEKVESYLSESRAKYLVGDTLHKADCYLLPTLQHIRVAGKVAFQIRILLELIFTTQLKLKHFFFAITIPQPFCFIEAL